MMIFMKETICQYQVHFKLIKARWKKEPVYLRSQNATARQARAATINQKKEEPLRRAAPVRKNKKLTSDDADYAFLRRMSNMARPPKPPKASVVGSGTGAAMIIGAEAADVPNGKNWPKSLP